MPIDGPFSHILACTDLSPNAAPALRWAAATAGQHGARLTLFHCAPAEAPPLALQDKVDRSLAELARGLGSRIDVEVARCNGQPWEAIVRIAAERTADLIVLGARGHTVCERLRLGSTADRVVRATEAPVLVVHPGDREPQAGPATVLLGIDFSADAVQAVHTAKRFLGPLPGDQRVVLLHAPESPFEYRIDSAIATTARHMGMGLDGLQRELESIALPLRRSGRRIETVITEGRPSSLLEALALRLEADMIVIGTRGQSCGAGGFLGRVAERVLHHASCPVITARARVP